MTAEEVARIVNLLISTWPNGVRGHVWTVTLGPLEVDHARAAYIELRDHEDRSPSVARFLAAYHAHRGAVARARTPVACELCDGNGCVPAPARIAHNPKTCRPDDEHPCACHALMPCRCSEGRRFAQRWSMPIPEPEPDQRSLL